MLKIGITGGKGFIGKHLAAALKEKKGIKISYFDLPENNLLTPGVSLKKFVKNNDVIIHAAAVNRGTNTEVIAGSVVAVYNLVEEIEKNKSRAKFIFLSSIQAETETLYGKSKKLAEIILEDFSRRNKAPVSIFQLTNVFGEGGRPFYNSAVATFCHQVAKGQKLTVHPQSRNKKINLIYIGEVADTIVKEVFTKRTQKFYFKKVISKNEIKVGDLAKLIESFKHEKPKSKNKLNQDLYKTYLSY